jgi:hypothetical protein
MADDCGFMCSNAFFFLIACTALFVFACSCYIQLYEHGVVGRPQPAPVPRYTQVAQATTTIPLDISAEHVFACTL